MDLDVAGPSRPIRALLVANRGEIAARILRTCRVLGIRGCAVHSDADAGLPFVALADDAVRIGPPPPSASYLDGDRILAAAAELGVDAIHPGYGFLSEDHEFARRVIRAGLTWVGPAPGAMEAMADKLAARRTAAAAGVPVLPGTPEPVLSVSGAVEAAGWLGYPVMVKAALGGGGIGMGVARDGDELRRAFESARGRAERLYRSTGVLIERFVQQARHVEVQVLGLPDGEVVVLGDRDCSAQRRHQKLVEEAPAPHLPPAVRAALHGAARAVASAVSYRNAGTVEFLLDSGTDEFWFLEMNTRLQVEHPVTELTTGIDLVAAQLAVAAGVVPDLEAARSGPQGHAVELRVYAEDPIRFLPGPGSVQVWEEPAGPGIRVDGGYAVGTAVTPYYDPLMAKLCAWGSTRQEALSRALEAVRRFRIEGPGNNLPFLDRLLSDPAFRAGAYTTRIVDEVLAGGVG